MPPIARLALMILAYVLWTERPKTVENGTEKAILLGGGVWSPMETTSLYELRAEGNVRMVC
jgi:hypothetical protein